MKKIVHILYSGLGGHGSVFFSLVKADKDHRFATEAIFCGIEKVRDEYISQCEYFQIPFYVIRKRPGPDPSVYWKQYKIFKKIKPDIIFLHGATFILPAIFYKKFNPTVKIIVRDTQAHHLKSKREWYWLKLAIQNCAHIVFLTQESLDGVIAKLSNTHLDKKAVIIPNGLDTDLYAPIIYRDLSSDFVFGMQSRLQPIKDHPTLLKAFALLLKKFPEKNIKLRIAGDGETRKSLEELAKSLQIDHCTEFCGMLNKSELITFMHSLDIYVHASFGETMSNSIMQAMSCGLPVIASNVWGIDTMVKNNESGLLYESGNEEDLLDKFAYLLTNKELRLQLSQAARKQAEENYSLDIFFHRYKNIFD